MPTIEEKALEVQTTRLEGGVGWGRARSKRKGVGLLVRIESKGEGDLNMLRRKKRGVTKKRWCKASKRTKSTTKKLATEQVCAFTPVYPVCACVFEREDSV